MKLLHERRDTNERGRRGQRVQPNAHRLRLGIRQAVGQEMHVGDSAQAGRPRSPDASFASHGARPLKRTIAVAAEVDDEAAAVAVMATSRAAMSGESPLHVVATP